MKKHFSFIFISITFLLVVGIVAASLLVNGSTPVAAQPVETPIPFLSPMYYGQEDVWQIFDHEYPLFSSILGGDGNNDVLHYDDTLYLAVTITPDPNASPTPEGWATPAPYIPVAGYGYDQHIGIDYSLRYEPVLAAAEGTISFAGWADPTNHQSSYGLHVQMVATANQDYKMWYGHLSTLNVQTDDVITASYEDRNRILGISGNTGSGFSSSGSCDGIPIHGPNCGEHLHFEVRLIANGSNKPVNPYGWIGTDTDPWSVYNIAGVTGATSHNLWANPPAINTAQYPGGTAIAAPPHTGYFIEVDDSDPELFELYEEFGACWTNEGEFHQAVIQSPPSPALLLCHAKWSLNPDTIAPAGSYDIYARIPPEATSLTSQYTIYAQGELSNATVVQGAYPNDEHGEWAYIGQYDFAMNGIYQEYIRLNYRGLFESDVPDTIMVADAIRLYPAEPVPDLEISIIRGSDDASGPNSRDSGWCTSENHSEEEIYFGHCDDGSPTISGLRFDDVPIPKNATITAARLEFVVDGPYNQQPLSLQISGEAGEDPGTFDTDSLPSTRTLLGSPTISIPWLLDETNVWRTDEADVSPDISHLIQAMINQPSWKEGNAMVFIIQPTGSGTTARRVFAWEREMTATKLQLWFNAPPPAPTGLNAVYYDGVPQPHVNKVDDYELIGPVVPNTYVRLSWPTATYPAGTTFKVYRSGTGTPIPPQGLIGTAISVGGLSSVAFWDYSGQNGDWYVITAVNTYGESAPSTPVQARPLCPPSIC